MGRGKASEINFNTGRGSIAKCTYTHVCTDMYMLLNVHTPMHVRLSLVPGHNLNSTR